MFSTAYVDSTLATLWIDHASPCQHKAFIIMLSFAALPYALSTAHVECPGASLWTDHASTRPCESFTIVRRFSTTPHAHYAMRFPQPMWNALGQACGQIT